MKYVSSSHILFEWYLPFTAIMSNIPKYKLAWQDDTISKYAITRDTRAKILMSLLEALKNVKSWRPSDATLNYLASFHIHLSLVYLTRLEEVLGGVMFDSFIDKWLLEIEVANTSCAKRLGYFYSNFSFFNHCLRTSNMIWIRRIVPYLHDIPAELIWNLFHPIKQEVFIDEILFADHYSELRAMLMHTKKYEKWGHAIIRCGNRLDNNIGWGGLTHEQKAILMMMPRYYVSQYLRNYQFTYGELEELSLYYRDIQQHPITLSTHDVYALQKYYHTHNSTIEVLINPQNRVDLIECLLCLAFCDQVTKNSSSIDMYTSASNELFDVYFIERWFIDKMMHFTICKQTAWFHVIFDYFENPNTIKTNKNKKVKRFFRIINQLRNRRFIVNRIVWAIYGIIRERDYVLPEHYGSTIKSIMRNNTHLLQKLDAYL